MTLSPVQGISTPYGISGGPGISPFPGISQLAVECAFPLNASAAEIESLGFQPMSLSQDDMSASWVTTSDGEVTSLAAPSGVYTGSNAKMSFTSGIRVIEFQGILMPAGVGGGSTDVAYLLNITMTTSNTAGGCYVRMYVRKDGTRYVGVLTDPDSDGSYTIQYQNTSASSFPSTVSIIVDCTGGSVSVLFDGQPVALSDDTFTAGQYFATISAYQNSSLAAGDVGKVVGATLVTSAASMAGGFGATATDPCGNAFSDYVTDEFGNLVTDEFGNYAVWIY